MVQRVPIDKEGSLSTFDSPMQNLRLTGDQTGQLHRFWGAFFAILERRVGSLLTG